MPKPSSHYDTLGVPRDASPEAIRTAYKALARHHHPDRNGNSPESHHRMQVLNAAFEVLNDPVNRGSHDDWLAEQNRRSLASVKVLIKRGEKIITRYAAPSPESTYPTNSLQRRAAGWAISIAIIVPVSWLAFAGRETPVDNGFTVSAQTEATFVRPELAPNGEPWPTHASELRGYANDRNEGASEVLIDNSKSHSEVLAQLVSIESSAAIPVRHVYLPARSQYRLTQVRRGVYEISYQDLASGATHRSDRFEVIETQTAHSVMKIRLVPPPTTSSLDR